MDQKKKKVVFHSNSSTAKTGFGRMQREVLMYLYKTGKYDLVEYAAGFKWSDPKCRKTPWKCHGTWPDNDMELAHIANHQHRDIILRQVTYGAHNIDKLIAQEKPDVYWGSEDFWAFQGFFDKKWWNKPTCVIHTTLDSLPLHQEAIDNADKIKNFFVWAKFAEKEMKRLGKNHVETLHCALDGKEFYKLPKVVKQELREINKIPQDAFVVGMVARNQLRKQFGQLIHGFKLFKDANPKVNAKLLIHTSFEDHQEGYDIEKLSKYYGLPISDVYATYLCRHCKNYEVKSFCGFDADCPFCGQKKATNGERTGQTTTHPQFGVTNQQLNEIYNLMDVYCHPASSGGAEIPIFESRLAELPVLVADYSFGEGYSDLSTGALTLGWEEYIEHGSNFVKATIKPSSICNELTKVLRMPFEKRAQIGKTGRKFTIDNFSIEIIGPKIEKLLDEAPFCDWTDYKFEEHVCDDTYPMPVISDNAKFLNDLYQNILKRAPDEDGKTHWMKTLNGGGDETKMIGEDSAKVRDHIYNFFIGEAKRQNAKNHPVEFDTLFSDNGKKRAVIVMPQSIGDCYLLTSLFASFADTYPEYDLYICTQEKYFTVFEGNPYVHKLIPFNPTMESEMFWIGQGTHKGFVDIAFLPFVDTQKTLNYLRNGLDRFAFQINKAQ